MIEFKKLNLKELQIASLNIDAEAFDIAEKIIDEVQSEGEPALRRYATDLDNLPADSALVIEKKQLEQSLSQVPLNVRGVLERTANRIHKFASCQRQSFEDCKLDIPGGTVGHRWLPLGIAGCYAPGGRYPLPSSVLMTSVTAKVAGVERVFVASPNPNSVTLAAAAVADADLLFPIGGAQAIAAFAFGIKDLLPACDVVVGPGNQYVTAAKAIVARQVKIDMLAGPSELIVVADESSNPTWVAADLLAQAEHDDAARPFLVAFNEKTVDAVVEQIGFQLQSLSTAETARKALGNGGWVLVDDMEQAVEVCSMIAPEHLSLQGSEVESNYNRFESGSALFVGSDSAEVFGDYGAGPNHVLPTGGTARFSSALSVQTFMRFQTIMRIDSPTDNQQLIQDANFLGELEGLEAHARSAAMRMPERAGSSLA